MALGLFGARGERHVHRRRSACDRAAFLWGLAPTQARAGEGTGPGWRRLVRSALAARRGRDDGWLVFPPSPRAAQQLRPPGTAPKGTLLAGCDGCREEEKVWRPIFLSAFLLAKCSYVRWCPASRPAALARGAARSWASLPTPAAMPREDARVLRNGLPRVGGECKRYPEPKRPKKPRNGPAEY